MMQGIFLYYTTIVLDLATILHINNILHNSFIDHLTFILGCDLQVQLTHFIVQIGIDIAMYIMTK